jgi:amino acid adenylation domain-containing protein
VSEVAAIEGHRRLSPEQERAWSRLGGGAGVVRCRWRLRGPLDGARLAACLEMAVARHEALRTLLVVPAGAVEPVQVVLGSLPVSWTGEVDAARGPLVVASLESATDDHRLHLALPALGADPASLSLLFREVAELYGGAEERQPSLQYHEFSEWHHELLAGDEAPEGARFWRQVLRRPPPPIELPVAAAPEAGARRLLLDVPAATARRLADLAGELEAAPWEVAAVAWLALLARLSGRPEVLVAVHLDGREHDELAGAVGLFRRAVPVRARFDSHVPFREALEPALDALAAAAEWQALLPSAVEIPSLFGFGSWQRPAPIDVLGVRFELEDVEEPGGSGVRLDFVGGGEHSAAVLSVGPGVLSPADAETLARCFAELLGSAVGAPDTPVGDLDLLAAGERRELLGAGAGARPEASTSQTLPTLFEAAVDRAPERPALRHGEEVLTFAELDRRGNRLANRLIGLGARPETPIGVLFDRSPDLVVACLAVLKSGGAYLPLDPEWPPQRLSRILELAAAPLLVTTASLARHLEAVPSGLRTLAVDDDSALASAAGSRPAVACDPRGLAYVIFTSGSTGEPKGVLVEHASVVNLLAGLEESALGDVAVARVAVNAPFTFDASVQQWLQLVHGRCVELVPEELRRDPERLSAWLVERRIDLFDCTPSHLRAIVDVGWPEPGPAVVLVGGEAVEPRLWQRLAGEAARFVNVYGPTECTVDATAAPFASAPLPDLGRPLRGVRLYVLDPRLQPLPPGLAGELAIAGAGLARGYLGRPAATADRFRPDPFADLHGEAGARLYLTGDRVRAAGDGRLEFLGRFDGQVKLRGFRIELGEVEAALAGHPEVDWALVLVDSAPAGDRLVAYVVPRGGRRAVGSAGELVERLRRHLRERLPAVMVPAATVVLDTIPITAHGKVDRGALPSPEAAVTAHPPVPPRTPVEGVVAEVWAEVLGVEAVSVEDDFFALGGHSLLAIQASSRMRAALGVELSLRRLLDAPTVAGVAASVEELRRRGAAVERPPLLPVPRGGRLPLSFAQERLWFLDRLEPGNPAYHIPLAVRADGPLSTAALAAAVAEIERRHEVLRTVFGCRDGEPLLEIRPPDRRDLPAVDLGRLEEADRRREARRLLAEEVRRTFDLAAEPVLRVRLLRAGEDAHFVAGTLHHIAGDGWSMDLLRRETLALYGAFTAGRPSPLPELPVQYVDYAAWQRGWLVGEALEAQLGYWRRHLDGAPPALELSGDRPRSMRAAHRGATTRFALPAELVPRLRTVGRAQGATAFVTLLTAFQVFLGRWTGTFDTVVGTPIAGRGRHEVDGLIGFFANTLALRADLRDRPDFRRALDRMRDAVLAAHEHQDVPFERLVQELAPQRSPSITPIFQVMYLHQAAPRPAPAGADVPREVAWTPLGERGEGAAFDLTLATFETADGLAAAFEYDLDLFDRSTIDRLGIAFRRLLAAALADPSAAISSLPLLDEAERRQVLDEWSDGGDAPVRPPLVHERVAARAAQAPDAPAVMAADGQTLTYGELWERASALAERLRRAGVGPEATVGIVAEREPEVIVALLAVLVAGGAYVPLDPRSPVERREAVLAETGCALVLAGAPSATPPGVEVLILDEVRAAPPAGLAAAPAAEGRGDALAYVIYTSGSTGRPKGVGVTQAALAEYVAAAVEVLGLTAADRMLQVSSIAFDAAAEEIFCCLAAGGCLVLADERFMGSAGTFLAACEEAGVTVLDLPTALWHELVAALAGTRGSLPPSVRLAVIGGERALPERRDEWLCLAPEVRLVNSYGPTETTIVATVAELGAAAPAGGRYEPSIGRPLPGTRVYVVDPALRPVPVGMPGELLIGGSRLARGYLRQPARTAERFLPDPWAANPGGRLYRTGDRVRWCEDGGLEFLGRLDRQVKLRGHRIEPGEVEAALAVHPEIEAAAADVRAGRLVAWATARPDAAPTVAGLREHLAARLPSWMLPQGLALVETMPRTAGGKVDRSALPVPPPGDLPSAGAVAPRDAVELELAGVWEEVLERRPIGVRDDFFALGGHSLLAVRLLAAVEKRFGRELPLHSIFSAPTIELQGGLLRARETPAAHSPRVALRRGGSLPPLFLVHAIGGGVFSYLPLVRRLEPTRPVYAFQARGFAAAETVTTRLETMATDYLAALREVEPEGPYLLAGWSMGGVVAYEMARRLREEGGRIELLALFDAHLADPAEGLADGDEATRLALFADELGLPRRQLEIRRQDVEALADEGFARLVAAGEAAGALPPGTDAAGLERLYRVFCANLEAHAEYRPAPYAGPLTLFTPRAEAHGARRGEDWDRLAASVERIDVPGDHFTMMREPAAAELAAALDRVLAATGGAPRRGEGVA